jgi:hypothetical protein
MDIRPMVNGRPVDPDVEAELERLGTMSIAAARIRYRELFRTDPPAAFGPDLLRRSIAQRVQEKAYGSLTRESRKLLNQLIRSMASGAAGRLEIPQRIKPGSELVRSWKGQTHKVTVLAKGFGYQGEVFASLSEVAHRITGTKWSGPKFFGLRATKKEVDKKVPVRVTLRRADHGRD